jgi:CRP-like cAMP-binding protein
MNEDDFAERSRAAGSMSKATRAASYTAKDFQLEVLGQLAEMQGLTEALQESLANELKKSEEQSRLLRFDGRTLIAIGAIALSLTGYVLQDARNSSRRDVEIETVKVRMTNLERIAATNTEARIRTEVQLGELRQGQEEIKAMIVAHDLATKKAMRKQVAE